MRRKILVTAFLSALMLGACGVKGSLKTPPPLWGEQAKQDYENQKQQEEKSEEDEEQPGDDAAPDT